MSKGEQRADPNAAGTTEIKKPKSAFDPERWKGKGGLAFRPTPEFFKFAEKVVRKRRTLLGFDRLYVFWQVIHNVKNVQGSVAEVGTFRGGSAFFIASALAAVTGEDVPFHVFDTFEGHPEQAVSEHDKFHNAGRFGRTSYEDVRKYLARFSQLQVHQGDILERLPHLTEASYRLVHLDTDLYAPTLRCLEYFGRRVAPGGVIVIDDYSSRKCPGVPKAVGEYLGGTRDFQVWDLRTEQLVLVKR